MLVFTQCKIKKRAIRVVITYDRYNIICLFEHIFFLKICFLFYYSYICTCNGLVLRIRYLNIFYDVYIMSNVYYNQLYQPVAKLYLLRDNEKKNQKHIGMVRCVVYRVVRCPVLYEKVPYFKKLSRQKVSGRKIVPFLKNMFIFINRKKYVKKIT